MGEYKNIIELPEKLRDVIEGFVNEYTAMYVKLELVNTNKGRNIRLSFDGTLEMKLAFTKDLNEIIKQSKHKHE